MTATRANTRLPLWGHQDGASVARITVRHFVDLEACVGGALRAARDWRVAHPGSDEGGAIAALTASTVCPQHPRTGGDLRVCLP